MTGGWVTTGGRVLAPVLVGLIKKMWGSKPGAYSVENPVKMGSAIPPRGGMHELSPGDLQKLSEKLILRITEANRGYAQLGYTEGEKVLEALKRVLGCELTMGDAQAAHLVASNIKNMLEKRVPDAAREVGPGKELYDKLLLLCCEHIVEFFTQRQEFVPRTLMEIRAGQAEVIDLLDVSRDDGAFEARFCETSAVRFEQAQLLGALEVSPEDRSYDLTTAYISLTVEADAPIGVPEEFEATTSLLSGPSRASFEEVLNHFPCLLLEGPAGSGKTTLLQNLAIHAMRGELPKELSHWKGRVPFFLKLRNFVKEGRINLPELSNFVRASGSRLHDEAPKGWASRLLVSGRSIVLIDGVDEVPEELRPEVFEWIRDLRIDYSKNTYIVTARPNVLRDDWRYQLNQLDFGSAQLQAMTRPQVNVFIKRWHEAQAAQPGEDLEDCRSRLADAFDLRRDLARLATNPLLCALMCALHRSNYDLPSGRTQLYKAVFAMMLGGREKAASIPKGKIELLPGQQEKLLSRLALWMVLNGQRSISRRVAISQVEQNVIPLLRHVGGADKTAITAECALDYVEKRSGLLQSPEIGALEFRHASLQDYLASLEILRQDSVGHLLRLAGDPLYHDVIIMAVGRTQDDQRAQAELLNGLVAQAGDSKAGQQIWLLAAACIADVGMVDPDIAAQITEKTKDLLPPRSAEGIRNVAAAGEFVLDLLADVVQRKVLDEAEAHAVASITSHFSEDACIPLLNRMGARQEPSVRQVVADRWYGSSSPAEFLDEVLIKMKIDDLIISPPDAELLASLLERANIQRLRLTGDRFTVLPVELLASNVNIERLILFSYESDLGPLAAIPHIEDLSILRSTVEFGELSCASHIRSLSLDDCYVDLGELPAGLENLLLNDLEVESGDLAKLGRLGRLRELQLDGVSRAERTVTGKPDPVNLGELQDLGSIERLRIGRTQVTNIEALRDLPLLAKIEVAEDLERWKSMFPDRPQMVGLRRMVIVRPEA